MYEKYIRQGDFLNCTHSTGSAIWRSIFKAKDVLQEGYQFSIGNGYSLFWYAPWTPFGRLCDSVFSVDIHDTNIQIKDLYFQNHWHWDLLWTALPDVIKDYIHSLNLTLNGAISDRYVWQANLLGEYSVKDGYKWI